MSKISANYKVFKNAIVYVIAEDGILLELGTLENCVKVSTVEYIEGPDFKRTILFNRGTEVTVCGDDYDNRMDNDNFRTEIDLDKFRNNKSVTYELMKYCFKHNIYEFKGSIIDNAVTCKNIKSKDTNVKVVESFRKYIRNLFKDIDTYIEISLFSNVVITEIKNNE